MEMEDQGDFKVIFIPQIGEDVLFGKECETKEEAELVLNAIADYTLLLHDCSLMLDYSNMGMVLQRTLDGWQEIDADGNEI